jgi:hypothetical protein
MKYTCNLCNFTTNIKTHYDRHLLTSKHITKDDLNKVSQKLGEISIKVSQKLGENDESKNEVIQKFICKYCQQTYKHKSSLSKHIKYSCTKNKDEDLKELVRLLNSQLQSQNSQLQTQNQQIQSQAKQIEKLMGKLEINGSFNTINANIQNNIQLLPYKNSDTSHLTNKDYEACIKKVNFCVMKLIEKIHFNPDKPENMNIYISNMKNKYLMVYDGKNWNIANKTEEIDKLYEEKELMLEEWLESNENTEMKEKFIKYLNNKENDETLNMIKEELKLLMYNKKQLLEN